MPQLTLVHWLTRHWLLAELSDELATSYMGGYSLLATAELRRQSKNKEVARTQRRQVVLIQFRGGWVLARDRLPPC